MGTDAIRGRALSLLAGLDSIPPMPPVARRLLELGDLASADIRDIAGLIEMDPGLTAGVLSMCRAAHTGLGDRITSVRQAVTMLGVECIRRLVISAAVRETLRDGAASLDERLARDEGGFDREGFWVFCVAVACAAERIAVARRAPDGDRAFVAGLLHGLGRFALELVAPRAMGQICRLAEATGVDASEAERRVLGIDHREAGARLASRWSLPPELVSVIGGAPSGGDGGLNATVWAARWVCREYHLGWSGDWSEVGPGGDLLQAAGLEGILVEPLVRDVLVTLGPRLRELGVVSREDGPADLAVMMARQANRVRRGRLGRAG